MASALKTMVSKNKNRYVSDGFNLDLSYITDRLIAMGFPAEKFESIYRNSSDDVKRFLDEKHPNHYKIYNLCSERIYDPSKFHGRVAHYPFDDHHPPRFSQIRTFCDDVTDWLARHQNNVAAVHCKAGKGRTGVMVCCFLLHSKVYATAVEVLDYYGRQRTQNEKGVTIPSQQRYINYYDVCLRRNLRYTSVKMYLTTVVVDHVPGFGTTDTYYLQFEVHCPAVRGAAFASDWQQVRAKDRLVRLEVDPPLLVSDDVKIEFSYKGVIKPKLLMPPRKEFHFWINTFFFNGGDFSDTTTNLAHEVNLVGGINPPPTDDDEEQEVSCDKLKSESVETVVECGDDGSAAERKSSNESDPGLCKMPEFTAARGATCSKISSCVKSATTMTEDDDEMNGSALTNLVKTTSISDDTLLLLQQQQRLGVSFAANIEDPPPSPSSSSNTAALSSFITERMRHSSVPQTSGRTSRLANNSGSSGTTHQRGSKEFAFHSSYDHHHPNLEEEANDKKMISVEGDKLSLRLNKLQIDKACKHRGKVYSPSFNVTLFLIKPRDQTADLPDYHSAAASSARQRTPLKNQSGGEHQPVSTSSSYSVAVCVAAGSGGEQSSQESSSEEENNVMDSSSEVIDPKSTNGRAAAAAADRRHTLKSRTLTVRSSANSISSPKTEIVGGSRTRSSHVVAPPPPRRNNLTSHHHHHNAAAADQNQFSSINNMMLASKTAAAVSQSTWI